MLIPDSDVEYTTSPLKTVIPELGSSAEVAPILSALEVSLPAPVRVSLVLRDGADANPDCVLEMRQGLGLETASSMLVVVEMAMEDSPAVRAVPVAVIVPCCCHRPEPGIP